MSSRGGVAVPETSPGVLPTEVSETSSSSAARAAVTLALTSAGIAGRVALQGVPSVEPIIAVAVAAGFYGGWRHGAFSGATAYYLSNFFVTGFQGPWTIFQCLGAGAAGALGGTASKVSGGGKGFLASVAAGTIIYELVVNAGSLVYTPWALSLGLSYVVAAVPYGLVHLASSMAFGVTLEGFNEKLEQFY